MRDPVRPTARVDYFKNGNVKARGLEREGLMIGFWEWFRIDGTRLRTGYFEEGEPVGEWTTFDKDGEPYKFTNKRKRQ